MNITFTSEIKGQIDKIEKIEFTSPVDTRIENNMRVFEFREPQNNIMNWIEVGSNVVNIITGPTTINLMLETDILVEYQTQSGTIHFTSHMKSLTQSEDIVNFVYTLSQGANQIGEYSITLRLS